MNKATPVQMRTQLEMVDAFKKAGVLFIPIPALNHKDAENLTDMMVERVELLECGIPKAEQTCLNCEFEPDWCLYKNGSFGECKWYHKTDIPLCSVNVYPRRIDKKYICKNCPAWRPKI